MPRPTGNPQVKEPETTTQPAETQTAPPPASKRRRFFCPSSAELKLLYRPPIEGMAPVPGMPYRWDGKGAEYIEFKDHRFDTDDPGKIECIESYTVNGVPMYLDGVKGVIRDEEAHLRAVVEGERAKLARLEAALATGGLPSSEPEIVRGVRGAGPQVNERPTNLVTPHSIPAGPNSDWNPKLSP